MPVHTWVEPIQPKVPASVTSLSLPHLSVGRQSYRRPSSFLWRPHLSWRRVRWGHVYLSSLLHSLCLHKHAFTFGAFHPACRVTTDPHTPAGLSSGCGTRVRGNPARERRVGWSTCIGPRLCQNHRRSERAHLGKLDPRPRRPCSQRAPEGHPGSHPCTLALSPLLVHAHPIPPSPQPPPISRALTTCWAPLKKFKNHFNNPEV